MPSPGTTYTGRAQASGRRWRVLALIAASVSMTGAVAETGDFYLRAGLGLDHPAETVFSDRECSSTSPAALYGCGTGPDGAPYRSVGDVGTAVALDLGVGRFVTPRLRLEALVGYRPRLAFRGRANFLEPGSRQSVAADLSSLSAMLEAYADLREFVVPALGTVVPFLGAGAGVVRTRIGATSMSFPRTMTTVPGGARMDAAWMLTAGVATALSRRTTLELAWRYADHGEVRTDRGPGMVEWRDGSREPLPLDLAETRARIKGHGIRVSLRFAF